MSPTFGLAQFSETIRSPTSIVPDIDDVWTMRKPIRPDRFAMTTDTAIKLNT